MKITFTEEDGTEVEVWAVKGASDDMVHAIQQSLESLGYACCAYCDTWTKDIISTDGEKLCSMCAG